MARVWRILLACGALGIGVLLFLLATAAGNTEFFGQDYNWLIVANAVVALVLAAIVMVLLARLYQRYKKGRFGSRLTARLVTLFAVMGLLPGIVIYLVSFQFVSRSIESWFDVRVESALESGLVLGRAALDSSLAGVKTKADAIAAELAGLPESGQTTTLARALAQHGLQDGLIVTAHRRLVAAAGEGMAALTPDLPPADVLQAARLPGGYARVEGGEEPAASNDPRDQRAQARAPARLRLRVVVAIPVPAGLPTLQNEAHFLQVVQVVDAELARNAEALRIASSEYQTRSLARSGLRKIYMGALTLTLLLAGFGAVAIAFVIADNLAQPLLLLAEGTRAVAEGDLRPRPIVATADELGTLTQSFNIMTRQLLEARTAVEKNRAALENAKVHLESVLANMSAGVLVLDRDFRLVTCNDSVARILHEDLERRLGEPLTAIGPLAPFADAVTRAFSEQSAHTAADGATIVNLHWQQQIEIPRPSDADGHPITLLARGSRLPVHGGTGYIVVFDDVSDVISAQRSTAWGEVARRLAHEIKNPLTPIQLSAERLRVKLDDKLEPADQEMLKRGTNTIINQVAAMKQMVDDFRNYARTPPAVLQPLDLNRLIGEILNLYIAGDERDIVHPQLAPGLPEVMGDATQMRQVVHNLLQNAQDAMADRGPGAPRPHIDVVTEAVRYQNAQGAESTAVRLSILDNGAGFPSKILARAFEPYVTSKPRGTGLGLAMVKKIVEEHGGRIDIANRTDQKGAKVSILLLKLATV